MPPPAETFTSRLFLGPALRTQPDGRLVSLVREGYENAFEEIVRRYGKSLTRYAAAIVGSRGEDVTQDAFSKALLALRRNDTEIELRPWLFRIVRNTALNDLRDSPPTPELLAEAIAGGESAAETQERREELTDLMRRLRSLPETQRAAIVMREMEGLSHEEIATALGVSGGAARQAIYRARRALRDGAGMLLPLPLVKALLAGATTAPVDAAAGAAGLGGAAGAGVALKAATATVLVAGALGAGVAIDHSRHGSHPEKANAQSVVAEDSTTQVGAGIPPAPTAERGAGGAASDLRGHSGSGSGSDRGSHKGPGDSRSVRDNEPSRNTQALSEGNDGRGGDGHRGPSRSEPGDDHGGSRGPSGHDDPGDGGGHQSGRGSGGSSGPGSSSPGDDGGGDDHSGPGGGSSTIPGDDSGSSVSSGSNSGPGSGGDDSGSGDKGGGDEPVSEDSSDSHGGDGFSTQKEPQPQEEP